MLEDDEKQNRNIGALWVHESKTNQKFLSGKLRVGKLIKMGYTEDDEVRISIFKKALSSKKKSPDYDIVISKSEANERK